MPSVLGARSLNHWTAREGPSDPVTLHRGQGVASSQQALVAKGSVPRPSHTIMFRVLQSLNLAVRVDHSLVTRTTQRSERCPCNSFY